MKLLVLAQTPPPLHGQSAMVQLLIQELGQPGQGFELHHVNLGLSRTNADVGRWRPHKFLAVLMICVRVWLVRLRHGPMTLYYVPAPGKRGALYRDWAIMALCRGLFPKLVLHWHAVGLGQWLETHATTIERSLTRKWLGRSDLSLVLAPELAADIERLWPRRVAVVPNSLSDPDVLPASRHVHENGPFEVLYLGTCSAEKGLLDLCDALVQLHARVPGAFHLTVAGNFDSPKTEQEFFKRTRHAGVDVTHVGFADAERKEQLLANAHALCFPTYYPAEGQPLVLIEALAHDLPIITTRWRAIPGMLPRSHVWFVEPHRADQIVEALLEARKAPPATGELKEHYLLNFTPAQHVASLKKALLSLETDGPAGSSLSRK